LYHSCFLFVITYSHFSLKTQFDYKDISDLLHKMGNLLFFFYLDRESYTKRHVTEHKEWVFNIHRCFNVTQITHIRSEDGSTHEKAP